MAACCRVYDSCHLQADCQEPSMGYLFRRAAAHILLTAGHAAVIAISCLSALQQQTHSNSIM